MTRFLKVTFAGATMVLGGCTSQLYNGLPQHEAAYRVIPEQVTAEQRRAGNLLTAGDELTLNVVSEPELSVAKLVVDQSGQIVVPLIGAIDVSGHTIGDASRMIEERLGSKYLRSPHVALNLATTAPRYVSVDGQVNKAGLYPVTADTTLLSVIALAESTSKNAKLNEIIVFRFQNNERLAARFDLDRIRAGVDPDPQILPGDTVVVGFSHAKAIYHDVLTAAPLLSIFRKF